MTSKQRRLLSVILGIAVSAALVALLAYRLDFDKLYEALVAANYWWLVPNIVLVMAAMYQRAWRWKYMLEPIKTVLFPKLLAATCIGFMANNVLPLRLGEFVRAYSLAAQDKEISKSTSLATIFVERMVFDLVALLLILGGVLTITSVEIPENIRTGGYMAVGIALFGLAMVVYLALRPTQAGNLLTRYLFFLSKSLRDRIKEIVVRFSAGLEFLKQPRTTFWISFHTLLVWLVMGISNYFVLMAFNLNLPLEASYFLLVVVSISILLPSTPGFIGVYHAAVVITLDLYQVDLGQAVSIALVLHAAQYIPITLMGFYYLRKEHLSLKQLEAEATS